MFRSDLLIPGSDFLIAGLSRVALAVGAIGLLVIVVSRLIRRKGIRLDGKIVSKPLVVIATIAVVGLVATVLSWPPKFETPEFPELPAQLLPSNSLFYRPIDDLPVAADSERWISALKSMPLVAPFGGNPYLGNVAGMPFNVVDDSTKRVDVTLTEYPDVSFKGPYPIADPPLIEGLPNYGNDQHYLAVDTKQRRAWELIALRRWFTRWEAGAGGTWSMDSLDYPDGSTIVARLPLLPGVVRYEEVASGSVNHMILGMFEISAKGRQIWPAKSTDGTSTDPDAPPMGGWMRLRRDADLSKLGPQAKVVATAAQRYGILISDTGPGFRMRGTADRRWDQDDLRTLQTLTTDDFEFVDASSIMVSSDSLEVTQP